MKKEVWLVYDGECPICRPSANALKIKEAAGTLHLVNARESHPILEEIKKAGLNLDDGMVVKMNGTLYHGSDAQHILAMIGTNVDWFNRMNVLLFHSKFIATLVYPILRFIRNIVLKINGTQKLNNLVSYKSEPIFQSAFGKKWDLLPDILRKRYSNTSYSNDAITARGKLDVSFPRVMYPFLYFCGLFNMLVPYRGNDVPVEVNFISMPDSSMLCFNRIFHFPNKKTYQFCSYMKHIKDDIVVEYVLLGMGLQMQMHYEDGKVVMHHGGYVWRVFGKLIPIPLSMILGKVYAEEKVESHDSFSMLMQVVHPLFGTIFRYSGKFKIEVDSK